MNPEHQLEDPVKIIERMQRECEERNRVKKSVDKNNHTRHRTHPCNTSVNHSEQALRETEERIDRIFHPDN